MVQRFERMAGDENKRAEPMKPSVDYDEVDEASDASYPASDPPARGVTRVGEPKRPCDPVPSRPSDPVTG